VRTRVGRILRRVLKNDRRFAREAELPGGEEEGVGEGLSSEKALVVGGDCDLGRNNANSGHGSVGYQAKRCQTQAPNRERIEDRKETNAP
jgi:hypothetical protein